MLLRLRKLGQIAIAVVSGLVVISVLQVAFRPNGFIIRQYGNLSVSETTSLVLVALGLGLLGWNVHVMVSTFELELGVRRKLYQLASDIHFVTLLNEEVISQLKNLRKEDSTIEIIEGDKYPPWEHVLRGRSRERYET